MRSALNRPIPNKLRPLAVLLGVPGGKGRLKNLLAPLGAFVSTLLAGLFLGIGVSSHAWYAWVLMVVFIVIAGLGLVLAVRWRRAPAPAATSAAPAETYEQRTAWRDNAAITVVMPAYNEEKWLPQALASLQAQTYRYWKAVVIDDNSRDNTAKIAAEFASKDPRISIVRLRKNGGLPAARNVGIALADTPFIQFLDSDDAFLPSALETRLDLLMKSDDAAGVAGRALQVREGFDWRALRAEPQEAPNRVTITSTHGENLFLPHDVLLRTEVVQRQHGFTEWMRAGAEDADFWTRLLRSGHEFLRFPKHDAIYRQKATSMVARGFEDFVDVAIPTINAFWTNQMHRRDVVSSRAISAPLGDLMEQSVLEQRLYRYLGMAAGYGDEPSIEVVRSKLAPKDQRVMSREAARTAIRIGANRSIDRRGYENATLREANLAHALQLTESDLPDADTTTELSRPATPRWVVLAENAAHVVELERALAAVPDEQLPLVVVSDAVHAPMGAGDKVAASNRPWTVMSFVQWSLERCVFDVVLVPSPLSWVGEHMARAARESGSHIYLVDYSFSSGVAVEDAEFSVAARAVEALGEVPHIAATDVASLARGQGELARADHTTTLPLGMPSFVSKTGSRGDYHGLVLPDIDKLKALKDKHRGEKAIIIGNGPSLNKTDFGLLKDVHTFGVNGIFYADDRLPKPLSYYVVEDTKVFEENTEAVLEYGKQAGTIILPTMYKDKCPDPSYITFFRMNGGFYNEGGPDQGRPRFSVDATEALFCGQSVTYINLQLAYWMGFSEVGLIGMDFSYALPDGTVVNGIHYTSQGDDPNHFDPRYFGAGKTWKDPKLNRVGANYSLAKAMYEADGRRVVNCTVGGALEIFDRVELSEFVKP